MIVGIIPARYSSSRFPGKPLVDIGGVSMIVRVYRQAIQATTLSEVIVATDDIRIEKHCLQHGVNVRMTSEDHICGTERMAELAMDLSASHYINIQGDEPFISPLQIDAIGHHLLENKEIQIATLYKSLQNEDQIKNPNIVKVVVNRIGHCQYFSRNPIPFVKNKDSNSLISPLYFKHIGLYGFEKNTLLNLVNLSPSSWEIAESLEQLRWLQHGYTIWGIETALETIGIDTPDDLDKINEYIH